MSHRRSAVPLAISVVLHAALLGIVMYVGGVASSAPRIRAARSSLIYRVFTVPPSNLDVPVVRLTVPRSLTERPEPPKKLGESLPPPERPVRRAQPEPAPREALRADPAPKLPPAVRERPAVIVGVFSTSAPATRNSEPVRRVQTSGFEAPEARAPELKVAGPSVGAFASPTGAPHPRPGTDRPVALVAQAGFGGGVAAPAVAPARGAVTDAGFAGTGSQGRAGGSEPRVAARDSGFDARLEAPKPVAPERERIDTPVEIVFKPTPTYTDEARALKIEGDVVLDVEFTADSRVRVLRVVRGLGHGLDEAASRAAERMRFKPALSGGRPVGFQATVHILFRLT